MLTEIVNTAMGLADRVGAVKALALSRKALLRACCFEATQNLDLLDLADVPALKNAAVDDPSFGALLAGLETALALSILFSGDAPCRELYALLETVSKSAIRGGF